MEAHSLKMRRISDMLRTLWKNVKKFAHKNVRFLPTFIFVSMAIFLIPLSFGSHGLRANEAHASWLGEMAVGALEWVFKGICWLIFKLTGLIFAASGKIFDLSMTFSMSGTLFKSFTFIETSWVLVRDIINSFFIFAILLVAFKQLLSMGNFNAKEVQKTVVGLIIAALLINFSLFFTKAAIDVSNLTSRALYYTMKVEGTDGEEASYGPAYKLMDGLELRELLKEGNNEDTGSSNNMRDALIFLGGSAVHLVGAFTFFLMAFYFLVRIAILIILMITSPVYFITYIVNFGALKKLKADWEKNLQGQLIFPIIYLAFMFLVVNIVDTGLLAGKSTDGTFSDGLKGGSSGFAIIVNFFIVIALMITAFTQAKQMAGGAAKWGGKLAGATSAFALGAGAAAGRHTLGRLGGVAVNKGWGKEWAKGEGKFGGAKRFIGDKVITGANKAYTGTWDMRNSQVAGAVAGTLEGQLKSGVKLGKGTTKNAKENVREFGELTSQGKKKEAIRQVGKINAYNSLEARVSSANSRLGKNINEKEYDDFRKALIEEIKKETKGKPKDQEKLIKKLVGEETYNTKSDYTEIRKEIRVETAKEEVKSVAKKADEVRKKIKEKDEEIKKVSSVGGDTTKLVTERAELQSKFDNGYEETEKDGTVKKYKSLKEQFEEATKIAPASAIAGLSAENIETFKDKLTSRHLEAINKRLADFEFSKEDEEKLNNMAQSMRIDPNTKKDIVNWFNRTAEKGMSGFMLAMNAEIESIMTTLKNPQISTNERVENERKLMNMMRQITQKEVDKMEISTLTDEGILPHLSPKFVTEYSKKIHNSNDGISKQKLADIANNIGNGHSHHMMSGANRQVYSNALLGIQPPKKKGGQQGAPQGSNPVNLQQPPGNTP